MIGKEPCDQFDWVKDNPTTKRDKTKALSENDGEADANSTGWRQSSESINEGLDLGPKMHRLDRGVVPKRNKFLLTHCEYITLGMLSKMPESEGTTKLPGSDCT
jgi:hypothetical protein